MKSIVAAVVFGLILGSVPLTRADGRAPAFIDLDGSSCPAGQADIDSIASSMASPQVFLKRFTAALPANPVRVQFDEAIPPGTWQVDTVATYVRTGAEHRSTAMMNVDGPPPLSDQDVATILAKLDVLIAAVGKLAGGPAPATCPATITGTLLPLPNGDLRFVVAMPPGCTIPTFNRSIQIVK